MKKFRAVNLTPEQMDQVISILSAANYYEWDDVGFVIRPREPVAVYLFQSTNHQVVKSMVEKGIEIEACLEVPVRLSGCLPAAAVAQQFGDPAAGPRKCCVSTASTSKAVEIIAMHQLTNGQEVSIRTDCKLDLSKPSNLRFFLHGAPADFLLLSTLLAHEFTVEFNRPTWQKLAL